MSAFELDVLLSLASAFFGFVAAGLWFWSTFAYVVDDPEDHGGKILEQRGSKMIDLMATGARQTKINRWAALATAVGTALAACAILADRVL